MFIVSHKQYVTSRFLYRHYELISNLKSKFANVCDRVMRFDNIIDIAQRYYETREEKRISETHKFYTRAHYLSRSNPVPRKRLPRSAGIRNVIRAVLRTFRRDYF